MDDIHITSTAHECGKGVEGPQQCAHELMEGGRSPLICEGLKE